MPPATAGGAGVLVGIGVSVKAGVTLGAGVSLGGVSVGAGVGIGVSVGTLGAVAAVAAAVAAGRAVSLGGDWLSMPPAPQAIWTATTIVDRNKARNFRLIVHRLADSARDVVEFARP
jgi:hypothetical protein